jgi:hypothetical protein
MASGQSNRSSQPASDWIDKVWHIEQVNGSHFGVWSPDVVTFANVTTGTMVQILSSNLSQNIAQQTTSNQPAPWPWGTLNQSSVTTAMSSAGSIIQVTGQTTWGQPFRIEYPYNGNPKKLACYIDESPSQIPWNSVALGTIAGTVLGAAVGFAARFPGVGALAGLVAAAASLMVARTVTATTNPIPIGGGGSTPTWVANDGPPGGRPGQPGPHLVDGTTA